MMLTGKQLEYIHSLEELGYSQAFCDKAQEELEDENHPGHKERMEDFYGFELAHNFITPLQHKNKINELYGEEVIK